MEFLPEHWALISAICTFVGGTISWVVSQIWASKKHESSERADFITRVNEYSDRQDIRLKDRDDQIEILTKQLIEARLQISENTTHTPPLEVIKFVVDADIGIMWVKRRVSPNNFVMIRVSRGYAQKYLGGSQEAYDNLPDDRVWPKDLAQAFNNNDEQVYQKQQGIEVNERMYGSATGVTGYFRGRKYPLRVGSFDLVFGIGDHFTDDETERLNSRAEEKKASKRKKR
jgi:hypothetical protein